MNSGLRLTEQFTAQSPRLGRLLADAVVVLPEGHELRFSDVLRMVWMMEAMHADFYRSILGPSDKWGGPHMR
jgi:hypothetical protein